MSTLSNSLSNLTPLRPGRVDAGLARRVAKAPEAAPAADEMLVADSRAALSPSEMVERKLFTLLNGKPLPANATLASAAHRYVRRT